MKARATVTAVQMRRWPVNEQGRINPLDSIPDEDVDFAIEAFLWAALGRFPNEDEAQAGRRWLKNDLISHLIQSLMDGNGRIRYGGISQLIGERGDVWLQLKRKWTVRQSDSRVKSSLAQVMGINVKSVPSLITAAWPSPFAIVYMGAIVWNNYASAAALGVDKEERRSHIALIGAMLCVKYRLIMIDGLADVDPPASDEKKDIDAHHAAVAATAYEESRYFPERWAIKTDKAWRRLVDLNGFKSPHEEFLKKKCSERDKLRKKGLLPGKGRRKF